ncbi:MAG: ATP-binding protein, partial [Streptosporangiaceae bacterium]
MTNEPGSIADDAGEEALWNGLHGVLRRGGLAGMVSRRPHVAFEVGFSSGRLRFGLWVPATVSAGRVARVAEAAWPGAVTEVLPA